MRWMEEYLAYSEIIKENIEYVMDRLGKNITKVRNIKGYLLVGLFKLSTK